MVKNNSNQPMAKMLSVARTEHQWRYECITANGQLPTSVPIFLLSFQLTVLQCIKHFLPVNTHILCQKPLPKPIATLLHSAFLGLPF